MPRFRGEQSPRLAAKEKGVELLVGITFGDPLVCVGSESLFGAHWWAHGILNRRVYAIGTVELEEAIRPLFRRRDRMSPPYLCVATLEPDGRLRRLWLRPIWTDGRSFAVCDSEAERRFLHQAREEGAVIFKPMLISDLERLAPVLPVLKGVIQWAHLPDAIVWRAAAPVEIVEVKGSREEPDPDYDQRLAVKAAYYASLSPEYHYRQVEGWRLQEVATTVHSLEGIPMGEDEISMRAIMLVRAKRAEVCCNIME